MTPAELDRWTRKKMADLDHKIRMDQIRADGAQRTWVSIATTSKARLRRIPDACTDRLVKAAGLEDSKRPIVRALLLEEVDGALRDLSLHGEEPSAGPPTRQLRVVGR
jgi:hypothetical protein